MAVRSALIDFSLANPIYAGATVSLFLVDPVTGAKTTTLANLYAAPTGAAGLLNPQTLDSQGKWKQPVYFEDAVVAVVAGLSVPDHETGIIHPDGSWRGDWAAGTVYKAGDHFRDGADGANTKNIMVVLVDHVAGTYASDLTAAKFEILIDVSEIEASRTAAQAAATAAAVSEVAAAASAVTAGLEADDAAAQAAIALGHANDASAAQVSAEAARDATLAAYDQFDDRYLGSKVSAPTTDNDGNPLVGGALYFDTTDEAMKIWTGTVWVAAYVSGTDFLAKANNLSDVSNPATAFANIKQAATESASGVVEIATQPEVDAALDNERFVTPLKLHTNRTGAATTAPATNDIINFLDASAGNVLKKATIADILALTSNAADDDARYQALLNALVERRKSGTQGGTGLVKGHVDAYLSDTIGSASTNETYDATGDYYHNAGGYTADQVPAMTGYTAPSGTVTTNDDFNGAAWKAFSDANEDGASWNTNTVAANPTSKWAAYEFTSAKTIARYTIKVSASYNNRGPKSWNFQGWNGSSWVTLDTRTGVSAWGVSEKRTYDIASPASYQKYRVEFTEVQSTGMTLIIEEIEMIEAITPPNMTLTRGSAVTAAATPTTAWVVALVDPVSAVTYNTDYTVEVTSNNGTNWDAVTLTNVGSYDGTYDILVGKVTLTGGSTNMNYRKKSLNNKELRDAGIALIWG